MSSKDCHGWRCFESIANDIERTIAKLDAILDECDVTLNTKRGDE